MAVPRFVDWGGGLTYREVERMRQANDTDGLHIALKRRLENYLVSQVDAFALKDGKEDAFSAFPISVMTCIGIATLGEAFFNDLVQTTIPYTRLVDGQQTNLVTLESQRRFVAVAELFSSKLSVPFDSAQQQAVWTNWPAKNLEGVYSTSVTNPVQNGAALLYTYYRNKIIHTYQGQGAFLDLSTSDVLLQGGFMILNPNWFWRRFKEVFLELFVKSRFDPTMDQSWQDYVDLLLA